MSLTAFSLRLSSLFLSQNLDYIFKSKSFKSDFEQNGGCPPESTYFKVLRIYRGQVQSDLS